MQLQRRQRIITPEAQDWVRGLSSESPQAFGYAPAAWSLTLLAMHIRGHCREAGHASLAGLTYGTLSKLLVCIQDRDAEGA